MSLADSFRRLGKAEASSRGRRSPLRDDATSSCEKGERASTVLLQRPKTRATGRNSSSCYSCLSLETCERLESLKRNCKRSFLTKMEINEIGTATWEDTCRERGKKIHKDTRREFFSLIKNVRPFGKFQLVSVLKNEMGKHDVSRVKFSCERQRIPRLRDNMSKLCFFLKLQYVTLRRVT